MPYSIGETLRKYRNESKMTVKQISEILLEKGFKASEKTIYSWESGNSSPSPDALLVMCRAYGINDVLSAFGYDGYNEDGSIQLNIHEIDLIEKYRDLDPHGKDMVNTVLEKEHKRWESEQKDNNIIQMGTPDHLSVNAAHTRTDIPESERTEEAKQQEEDIMDDPDF